MSNAIVQPKKRSQRSGKKAKPKSKPGPPKTQPQKQVSKPMQSCPLQAPAVCDVDKLVLHVTVDDKKVPTMESMGGKRGSPVKDVKRNEVLRLLQAYDLVCDTVAQYPSPEDQSPDEKVKSGASAYFHGRKCAKHEHGVFTLTPLTPSVELKSGPVVKRKQGAASIDLESREYYANDSTFNWGLRDTGGIVALFEIIQSAWPLRDPKRLEYRADACGSRAKNDGHVRRQLLALVRVYRKDTYTIGVKIPPLGKVVHSREGQKQVSSGQPWTKETKTATTGVFGTSTTSGKTSGRGALATYEYSQETWKGGKGERHTSTRGVSDGSVTTTYSREHSDKKGVKYKGVDGAYSVTNIDEMLTKKGQDFELILKKNDRDWKLPFNKQKLIDSLKQTWKDIQKIQEAFRKVPQLGWKFEFSVSIFAGQLVVQFGPEVKKPRLLADGRYHPVDWVASAKIKMTVVDIKVELSFGIEWMAMGTGLAAKVTGEIGLKAGLDGSVKVDLEHPDASLSPKLDPKASIRADAYAKVAGWSIIDASISVEFALELKNSKLSLSLDKGMKMTGTLELKDAYIKGHLKKPWRSTADPMDPYLVMKGRTLYTFG